MGPARRARRGSLRPARPTGVEHRRRRSRSRQRRRDRNARGRPVRSRDQAGVLEIAAYDPFGNPLGTERSLRPADGSEADWRDPPTVALDPETHASESRYGALGRVVWSSPADGTTRRVEYLRGGAVASIVVTLPDGTEVPVLDAASFDAKGQPLQATLGNGVVLARSYDRETFRNTHFTAAIPQTPARAGRTLLDLEYTHDPVGNLTRSLDHAQEPGAPTPLLRGPTITTRRDFTYDGLYQLKTATGRVHQALLEHDYRPGLEVSGGFRGSRLTLNEGQAVERYTQRYDYDLSGNLTRVRHAGATRGWTTEFWTSPTSNRSLPLVDPGGVQTTNREARFDPAGNCMWLP